MSVYNILFFLWIPTFWYESGDWSGKISSMEDLYLMLELRERKGVSKTIVLDNSRMGDLLLNGILHFGTKSLYKSDSTLREFYKKYGVEFKSF